MPDVDVLLIGGGVASAACATQLRKEGFEGSIMLVGREPDAPYNRPPVSKGYLLGEEDREAALVHPEGWWADAHVDLRVRTSVMRLDTAGKVATLSTKDEVSFDKALIATGANVRRLPVDGADLEGIHYLRALRNADVLRDDVADADRVVMVGGSYIGTEVAASLTSPVSSARTRVSVEPRSPPMPAIAASLTIVSVPSGKLVSAMVRISGCENLRWYKHPWGAERSCRSPNLVVAAVDG